MQPQNKKEFDNDGIFFNFPPFSNNGLYNDQQNQANSFQPHRLFPQFQSHMEQQPQPQVSFLQPQQNFHQPQQQFLQPQQLFLQPQQIQQQCSSQNECARKDEPLCSIAHIDNIQFYGDRVELLINVIDFKPENLRLNVLSDKIEFITIRQIDNTQYNMITTRLYQLPERIRPLNSCCFINNEGILNIIVPWEPPN